MAEITQLIMNTTGTRNLMFWSSGLGHYTVLVALKITLEVKDQTFTSILVSVLGRKISKKKIFLRRLRRKSIGGKWRGQRKGILE